ncbi:MAG: preprotein translocase subunit SecA [Acinetobacter populi]|jgi:hypothetical protein|uniref:preprotein translocase subunit SecA n=1 Tax=Acinetobacter populi TaxID=1582270 RepID=UPI0023528C00|nr:preprotein translocase subunit SecA [Acinetobacter populi]MCH4247108.1 preprotein translocase subunit SecA [Acinetobacter populi]
MAAPNQAKNSFRTIDHTTWQWKLFLAYDVLMMALIVINLIILGLQAFILSDFGAWIAQSLHITGERLFYIEHLSPLVRSIDFYFICFLISELVIRWLIAIIGKHHRRWWFFPFIHWYEVLAIIPMLRFLRLLRAGVIAYRLHELGYKVVPHWILVRVKFYYEVVMEELTDRIVLTALNQIEKELDTNNIHNKIIHNIIDHHRDLFADTLAETLQKSLAQALAEQQDNISKNIGHIVNQAIEDTPELTQLLRLIPIVGGRIEQQIQSIGQRLGENITQGIIAPFSQQTQLSQQNANPLLSEISTQISQVPLKSEKIDALVESVVRESLNGIREQVKIKHWQQLLDENNLNEKSFK